MTKIFRILLCVGLMWQFCFALEKSFKAKDFTLTLKSAKPFTSGNNEFNFSITKDSKAILPQNLKITFFMPEMPGMPKMSEQASINKGTNDYTAVVNLVHGGTWQIKVTFEIDGKKYQGKSSIDF